MGRKMKSLKLAHNSSFNDKTPTGDIEYYQVAWQMNNQSTAEREFGALEKINDNYPKSLLTTDSFTQNRKGIKHLNVFNWLLEMAEQK